MWGMMPKIQMTAKTAYFFLNTICSDRTPHRRDGRHGVLYFNMIVFLVILEYRLNQLYL